MSEYEADIERIDIEQIMELIPHRHPFLLVDRVIDVKSGQSATGIKNVTMNENFFPGHFPGHPVFPGVLIVEAMAQTAAVLVVHSLGQAGRNKLVYFMTIDNARFRKPVGPGDQLHIKVDVLRSRGNVWKFSAKAYVEDTVCAEATYSAMIMDPEDVS